MAHTFFGELKYTKIGLSHIRGNFATYGWFRLEAETALTAILEIELAKDGKFVGGKIHAGKQEGRGVPALDPSGEAVKKIRSLSQADFGINAPMISDTGIISKR